MNMNCLALHFLAMLLMWKMWHKHLACQGKKLSLRAPGTTAVGGLEGRTGCFYLWTVPVLFCLGLMVPAFMITRNSAADPSFELLQNESVEDGANKKEARCTWCYLTAPLLRCRWPDVSGHRRSLVFFWLSRCPDMMSGCRDVLAVAAARCVLPLLHQITWKPWPFSHVSDTQQHQTHRLSKPAVALRKGQCSAQGGGTCCSSHRFFFWGCKMFLQAFSNTCLGVDGLADLVQVIQRLIAVKSSHMLS